MTTLEAAVSFYALRDTDPGRIFPSVDGVVEKFNDLPAATAATSRSKRLSALRRGCRRRTCKTWRPSCAR